MQSTKGIKPAQPGTKGGIINKCFQIKTNFPCLHIFCFISLHSGRGECCHLALVATSYKTQDPKEKNYSIFAWKLESDFQRKGAKWCLPNSEYLQAHAAAATATQRIHVKPCQSRAEALPRSSLFLSLFFLFSPPLYSSPQSRSTVLGPLSHPVTPGVMFLCTRGISKQGDGHWLLLLMTTLPRSWDEEASQRRSPPAKEPLQKGHSLAPHYLHS